MTRLNTVFAGLAALWAGAVFWLVAMVPQEDGVRLWTENLNPGGWMAWTFPVALFFATIAGLLILFTYLALRFPETPRKGILGIKTTRGDRLFISLLGAAFVCLFWLGLVGPPVWGGLVLALIYAAAIFAFA